MPGLAIIIDRGPKARNENQLNQMLGSMQHEPFYSSGTYSNEQAGLYVGWACHPGSYCDCMPIKNERGDRLLFFYGENHADASDFNRLRSHGNPLKKHDASYVLRLFEEKGYEFLTELNGWFHGVLLDLAKNEIIVFNDRFGMQRLYYHQSGDSMLYASEAKALLKVAPELRSLDARGFGEFLTSGCVLQNRTLFSGLRTLPAASVYMHDLGGLRKKGCYFKAETWENQAPLPEAEFDRKLKEVLPGIMDRYSKASLPVGVSLTGGYDTRLIMAFIDHQSQPMPCYTFGGMYRDCFDVKYARKVAKLCGCSHKALNLGKDFLDAFPKLAEKTVYISDGNLGASNAYELYLNKLARLEAPIRLTGSYGSEVLRGARAFKAVRPSQELIHPDFSGTINEAVTTFDEVGKCHNLTFSVYQQAPWFYYNRLAVEQSQVIVRTPFMDNDLINLMYQAPISGLSGKEVARNLIGQGNPKLVKLATDSGNGSRLWGWVSQFLFQADYCYKSGMPHWLERMHYLAGPFQPEKMIRGVHRFAHYRIWFRNELAPYIKDILLDSRTADRLYLNKPFIETMVRRHLKGDWNYTNEIEKVLTLELMHRLFIDRS